MVRLEQTEATGVGYRHRAWTRIADRPRKLSPLQNQFALSEQGLSEEEAVQQFRVWLWHELKDPFNVVSTELRQLATAHQQGREVEILVPKDAPHGAVIVRAIVWLAEQLPVVAMPPRRGTDPGPCYEPIVDDGTITTRAEIDPKYIVWITGQTQSRMGIICGSNQAFVPEYGVVSLKNFRWVNRRLASSPALQNLLNDELDKAFDAEADATPLAYDPAPSVLPADRFDDEGWFWEQTTEEAISSEAALVAAERDVMTLVEQLTEELGDMESAWAIAQMPDSEEWYVRQPPPPRFGQEEMMRPVYQYTGENAPLMIKSVEEQVGGKRFRPATKAEAAAYRRTFRQP